VIIALSDADSHFLAFTCSDLIFMEHATIKVLLSLIVKNFE